MVIYQRMITLTIFVLAVVTVVILWLAGPGIKSLKPLFQVVAKAVRERNEEIEFYEHEVERLDRIRNPSKYLGK